MGMPGSKTALEEMMYRVLGDFIQEGCVTKLANDLYCGGDSPEILLSNWRLLLESLYCCNLLLASAKTIICPRPSFVHDMDDSVARGVSIQDILDNKSSLPFPKDQPG